MARKAAKVELSSADRTQLEELVRQFPDSEIAVRAQMILFAGDGLENTDIAERVHRKADCVGQWRSRYLAQGIDGLKDKGNRGKYQMGEKPAKKKRVRETSWTFDTSDGLSGNNAPLYLNIYPGRCIIVTAIRGMVHRSGEGQLVTRNSDLLRHLENSKKFYGPLSLGETLIAAASHRKDIRTIRPADTAVEETARVLQSFRSIQIPAVTIVYGADSASFEGAVDHVNSVDQWLSRVRAYLPNLSDAAMDALGQLCSAENTCEPFIWERSNQPASTEEEALAELKDSSEDLVHQELDRLLSSEGMTTEPGELSFGMLTVVRGADGKLHARAISDPNVRQKASTYDYSSMDGFMHGVNQTEDNLIPLRNLAGKTIMEDMAGSVKKKKK